VPGDLVNFFLYVAEEVVHLPFFCLMGFVSIFFGPRFDLFLSNIEFSLCFCENSIDQVLQGPHSSLCLLIYSLLILAR
jgi:hypothetical protein